MVKIENTVLSCVFAGFFFFFNYFDYCEMMESSLVQKIDLMPIESLLFQNHVISQFRSVASEKDINQIKYETKSMFLMIYLM